jgi:hypothetical protein
MQHREEAEGAGLALRRWSEPRGRGVDARRRRAPRVIIMDLRTAVVGTPLGFVVPHFQRGIETIRSTTG